MNVSLISNPQTWELKYDHYNKTCFNLIEKGIFCFFSTVIWPALAILTPIFVAFQFNKYACSSLKQNKIIKILENEQRLKEYADDRIVNHERKMNRLKEKIQFCVENHFRKNNKSPLGGTLLVESLLKNLDLPAPSEQTQTEKQWNKIPKNYWKNIVWENYLSKDFCAISKQARPVDKDVCKSLRAFQEKYKRYAQQKSKLANCKETEKLEMARKIAEMSYIKHGIKKQIAKQSMASSLLWTLPTGIFWYLLSPKNDRALFENKKEHLENVDSLNKYKDLIDAHNGHLKNHNYVVPYCEISAIED